MFSPSPADQEKRLGFSPIRFNLKLISKKMVMNRPRFISPSCRRYRSPGTNPKYTNTFVKLNGNPNLHFFDLKAAKQKLFSKKVAENLVKDRKETLQAFKEKNLKTLHLPDSSTKESEMGHIFLESPFIKPGVREARHVKKQSSKLEDIISEQEISFIRKQIWKNIKGHKQPLEHL